MDDTCSQETVQTPSSIASKNSREFIGAGEGLEETFKVID